MSFPAEPRVTEAAPAPRDPFADDVLERLIRSDLNYQLKHGHYIVPLAERLLAARAEIARLSTPDSPVAVPGPASEPICPGCKRPVSECQAEDVYEVVDAPGPASEELCAHGCGDDAMVQHADGRMLCYPCYRSETGGDNERLPGCPTCSPDPPGPAPVSPAEPPDLCANCGHARQSHPPRCVLGEPDTHYCNSCSCREFIELLPADPVVSPADTLRRDPIDEAEDFVAAALSGAEWEVRDSNGDPPTWVERGVGSECVRFIEAPLSYAESCRIENLLNVTRALLAVGERDKADDLVLTADELLVLVAWAEVARSASGVGGSLPDDVVAHDFEEEDENVLAKIEELRAAAVLADEEDARP